jgi:hypothetical protein
VIDFEAAEPAILTLLAPLQALGCQVRGMPNQPQRQAVDVPGGARVIVGWFGAKPVGRGSLDGSAVAMSNRIVLEIFTPTLKGATGIYTLPGQIQRLLQGQRVAGVGLLEFEGWELTDRSDTLNASYYRGVLVFSVLSMAQGRW